MRVYLGKKEIAPGVLIEGRTYARAADLLTALGYKYIYEPDKLTVLDRLGAGINNIQLTRNFNLKEFACRCCGVVKLDPELVCKLQALRDRIGLPITITSGYRCPEHNRAVGGVANSQHLLGKAADVWVQDMAPADLAAHAEVVGFGGIGVYSNFVHVDTRAGSARWIG